MGVTGGGGGADGGGVAGGGWVVGTPLTTSQSAPILSSASPRAVSWPAPHVSLSAPGPPTSRSFPAPPSRRSFPAPPKSLSLPPLPSSLSALAPPRSVSLPAVPPIVAAPTVAVAIGTARHKMEAAIVERFLTFMSSPRFLRRPPRSARRVKRRLRVVAQETLKTLPSSRCSCSRLHELDRRAAREDEPAVLVPAPREVVPAGREARGELCDVHLPHCDSRVPVDVALHRDGAAVDVEFEAGSLVDRVSGRPGRTCGLGDEAVTDPEWLARREDRRSRRAGEEVELLAGT